MADYRDVLGSLAKKAPKLTSWVDDAVKKGVVAPFSVLFALLKAKGFGIKVTYHFRKLLEALMWVVT